MRNLFCAALIALIALPAAAETPDRRISVSGQAVIETAPDMAIVRLGVTHKDKQATNALRKTSDAVAALMSRLSGLGVAKRDVQTSSLSLGPVWNTPEGGGPRVHWGYEAANMITVRLRDIDTVGEALDALVSDGANRLDSIRFALQDRQEAMDEARRRAVANARHKAELLADAAGVTLGDTVSISEGRGERPSPERMAPTMMRSDSVPIAAGEVEIEASVSMVFGLTPPE
ncbi:SIMPL domain-containing protein [Sediminimonas qiaohouensis]|uniref:SIMPL domain-containing protein n=1 Tax=Sediminimonas qiaohouensis TaxID=552061 RepID=UPI000424F8F0|nr:SIMPL domain-containing protein [Sediminimonas qiaohouensis]